MPRGAFSMVIGLLDGFVVPIVVVAPGPCRSRGNRPARSGRGGARKIPTSLDVEFRVLGIGGRDPCLRLRRMSSRPLLPGGKRSLSSSIPLPANRVGFVGFVPVTRWKTPGKSFPPLPPPYPCLYPGRATRSNTIHTCVCHGTPGRWSRARSLPRGRSCRPPL